ncbi:hybrid sensor histidine kinase/response regulator [Rubrivivax rivuli]|uniref:histidine kinase n=1 Tax=Rubrivivax rivuli TaxID=1862385 RepID=A0A437RER5_9BURK|nr:transporter substrate-binding domain-containing protein [Rubrivivax rivuli]RVU45256.1 transporter substrate-binding domain-containing protein [Rubrivivax rivuli]
MRCPAVPPVALLPPLLLILCWLFSAPSLAAPSAASPAAPAPKVVRYGVLASFPPFQVWPKDGVPGGADIEIVGELARAAGLALQPVRYTDYRQLEADLAAGRVQLASSMARTSEREDRFLFTPPYAQFQLALLTRAEQPSAALLPDLAGRSIAVVNGYASQAQADRLFPLASRVVVASPREGIEAVRTGRADTLLESLPVLVDIIEREQIRGLSVVRRIDAPSGRLHLAVPVAEAALAQRLSEAVRAYPPTRVESLVEAWSVRAPDSRPQTLQLSAEDSALLAAWPAPVVGLVGREPPFASLNAEGQPEGLSVDMLRGVLRRLGKEPKAWVALSADQVPAALAEGRVDLLVGADEAAERASLLRFVGPFIEYPTVLVGRPESGAFDLVQLYGRRLALPPGNAARPYVESRHPGVRIVDCAALEACLQAVRDGEADATMTDVVGTMVAMARQPRADLQVIGAEPALRRFHSLALAERHAALVPLFKRALDVAVEQDMPVLKTRWFSRPVQADVLSALLRRYGPWAAAVLALLAGLWWAHSRRLHAEVRRTLQARQAAERVGAEKARFAAFLAHEVRNSLHSVIAGAELAREHPGGPANAARLAEAARGTLRLLNNLIDRDRLDAGRLRLHPEPARLGPLLQAVLREMAPAAEMAGLRLQLQGPAADPRRQIDALRLQQVLRNVLSNAIKYGAEGGPNDVELVALPPDPLAPATVTLEVRDRGRGVPEADVPGLFEPYGAAHRDTASAGLGLPISRELARLMGGDLTLQARPGGGTVVRITLQAEPLPEAPVPQPVRALHVLVVEDAEVLALLLARAFEQRGHRVEVAATVAQARLRLAAGGIDLLLSDLHLPDGSGAELLAWAQAELPAPAPWLLAMTADRDTEAAALEGPVVRAVLQKSGDAAALAERALREVAAA